MNINTYLPDDLAEQLDRLAEQLGRSRSAVMREALQAFLKRNPAGGWPPEVLEWQGDPDFKPFEAMRPAQETPQADPFENVVE